MVRRRINTILLSAIFFVTVFATAQMAPVPRTNPSHAAAQGNAGCQRIIAECRRLGFIKGQWKEDNGLYRDCFEPVVKGGQATR